MLLDVLGAHLSGAGLKSCQVWGSDPLLLREKLGVVSFLLTVGHRSRDGVFSKILSQPLLPVLMWGFLVAHCVGVSQLVLWFLSEEIVLYVAVYSVCLWEEVSSGSSYFTMLNHNFYCGVLMVIFCFFHSSYICCLEFFLRNICPLPLHTSVESLIFILLFGYNPLLLLFVVQIIPALGALSLLPPVPF